MNGAKGDAMKQSIKKLTLALAGTGLLTIYGCGGGGGGGITGSTSSIPITVIDGPIQNATVCLDKNLNGMCDIGEPTAKTDTLGNANLTVDLADTGKYPVLAVVGTDAYDIDTGLVPVRFTMSAPADRVSVVSPLTTLVQQTISSTGVSTADAVAAVQAATGMTTSPFTDFTKTAAPTDGSISAATVARMLVVTTQQQSSAVKVAEGSTADDGKTITTEMLDKAIQKKILELLPALVAAMIDPAIQAATGSAKETLLAAAASKIVSDSGLTTAAMATVVAINNQAPTETSNANPSAGFSLSSLTFTDAANWFWRVNSSSIEQDTPDGNGNKKYVSRRFRSESGAVAQWGAGSSPARQSNLHWNGTSWGSCPLNFENTSSARDANGNSSYNYCDNLEKGSTARASFDVSSRPIIDVYRQIKTAGYSNLSIGGSDNALATSMLGSTVFPSGSTLHYQTAASLTNAVSYYPGTGDYVTQGPTGAGAGRTTATDTNAVCASNFTETPATSLETLIANNKGTPCVNNPVTAGSTNQLSSGDRNEGWSATALSMGTIGNAPANFSKTTATSFYTSNTKLRVAFGAPGVAKYYSCQQRYDGSTRNCDLIGTGGYAIQTLGDARILVFSSLPALASAQNYTTVYVERDGKVHYGYQSKPAVYKNAVLNTVAATALFQLLGLPSVDPSVPMTLTAASYQGDWDMGAADTGTTITIKPDGSNSCVDRSDSSIFPCTVTFSNLTTGAFGLSGIAGVSPIGTLNFQTGLAAGTYVDRNGIPQTFVGIRR